MGKTEGFSSSLFLQGNLRDLLTFRLEDLTLIYSTIALLLTDGFVVIFAVFDESPQKLIN